MDQALLMKPVKIAFWRMALALLFCAAGAVQGQGISFAFTLDEPCKTSAGVYTPDGTLVRTLWSKVRYYAPGTYSAVWDGLDDNSNMAPTGNYEIKLLQHNTEYVWDGAIGNTSAEVSGPTVHGGFWPMADMAISGTNAFYVSAYDEGKYDFRNFLTTDPQHVEDGVVLGLLPPNTTKCCRFRAMFMISTGSGWRRIPTGFILPAPERPTQHATIGTNAYPGCIVPCNVGDNSPAYFASGVSDH